MRLEKIKLAGFKSFVDPTTLSLPSNRVGIVGPNGCGKSNLIDAVRWVMGESSARHLRGESMGDVVFNGSATRQPVQLASVELVFDNRAGKAPGEYAHYAQIAIKRQVSRDGQSTYWLNGARCRRRDIIDLFLGTGLGPRSYAIIEQGMISRLIEAKPDELRGFLEEAAGISKYKERRQETEVRLRHTQENLDRLNDLRDEINKQINSLQRQAQKAEKFVVLRDEEQRYRLQLLALRWRRYDDVCVAHDQTIQALEHESQQCVQSVRRTEQAQQLAAGHHAETRSHLEAAQGQFYELSAEIGRLEQALRGAEKNRADLEQALQRVEQEAVQLQRDLGDDQQQLRDLHAEQIQTARELDSAAAQARDAEAALETARRTQYSRRQHSDTARTNQQKIQQQIEVRQTHVRHLRDEHSRLEVRQRRLDSERDELSTGLDRGALQALQEDIADLKLQHSDMQTRAAALDSAVHDRRAELKAQREALHQARSAWQHHQGRLASLETLQQHAMGKDNQTLRAWLAERGLQDAPRLAECLTVAPGWERAVEAVLGAHLHAVCVASLPTDAEAPAGLALYQRGVEPHAAGEYAVGTLAAHLSAPWPLHSLIGTVYVADDWAPAQALAAQLAEHESVVMPDGVRLGRDWALWPSSGNAQAGVLQREQALREARAQQQTLRTQCAELETTIAALEQQLRQHEDQRAALRHDEQQIAAHLSRHNAEYAVLRTRLEQGQKRLQQIAGELNEIDEAVQLNQEDQADAQLNLTQLEQDSARWRQELNSAAHAEATARAALQAADQRAQSTRERRQALQSRHDSSISAQEMARKHIERLQRQLEQSAAHRADLVSRLADSAAPCQHDQARLSELRAQKHSAEATLLEARRALEAAEQQRRRLDEEKMRLERDLNQWRERLESARVARQADWVRRQTLQELAQEHHADIGALLSSLPADADENQWQTELTRRQNDMQKLGAVNLAAVDELQVQTERATYLQAQHADLVESLDTLTQAIGKIDQECRHRFKDTFDRVNTGLQRMFPKLFGGGHAALELLSQDWLNSGVTLMARPPGKRNSSIQLLSGGEKALTAVALVFAIFELNPAPFCLLDEVDAPLDEANVGRFGQLVKEMSETVQFIFISHNKVTMEIASQLAGVTMKEPGVSRIVAVDIDAAVELAAH